MPNQAKSRLHRTRGQNKHWAITLTFCASLLHGAALQAQTVSDLPATSSGAGSSGISVVNLPAPGSLTAPVAAAPGLQSPAGQSKAGSAGETRNAEETKQAGEDNTPPLPSTKGKPPAQPSEFERYVQRLANSTDIRRFGIDVVTPGRTEPAAPDYNPQVPPDYLVQVGDEVAITIWGSVNADLRTVVDRSGRVSVPRVGSVKLVGVRYEDLEAIVRQRVAQVFKNFDVSVSLGQLRGLRVYVTGFVQHPGAVTVNALSTITTAVLRAGGPSAAGSLRHIELRRNGALVSTLDLYDLLLNGNEPSIRPLEPGDVIRVGPIGPQVGLIGSVNQPAIFELKPSETVADLLKMAGGFAAVADTTRLTLERLDERATTRITELQLPDSANAALRNADVLRAFSAVDSLLPIARQNKRIHIEGEVARPGDYVMPPTSTLEDALRAAGGLTGNAFLYGTEFSRVSVREQQQINYERAIRDLEADLARANSTQRVATAEDASLVAARSTASSQLIERLRAVKPNGRVVLRLRPDSTELPSLALEDGDRLYVPPRPLTVGVFGNVFNPGNYLYAAGRSVQQYLELAGGPTRSADRNSLFVVHADGTVDSALQHSGWLGVNNSFWDMQVEAGDTVFSPQELDKTRFVQSVKDWTQILYQFGLGVAGLKLVGF